MTHIERGLLLSCSKVNKGDRLIHSMLMEKSSTEIILENNYSSDHNAVMFVSEKNDVDFCNSKVLNSYGN